MGYSTNFDGSFKLSEPLTPAQKAYLLKFAHSRRVKRDPTRVENMLDPPRKAIDFPVGPEGGYFVSGIDDIFSKEKDRSVIDYNSPPKGQPGLWCQWIPNEDGTAIEWDQGEKFYNYVGWLQYIIDNFLAPWGRKLNGTVSWQGEAQKDHGHIKVTNNIITIVDGQDDEERLGESRRD